MSWTTLEGNADYIRPGNDDVMSGYTDAQLEVLFLVPAKADLEIDLAEALGLDQNETDKIDDVLDLTRNMKVVQKALAYLQLKYFYMENMILGGVNEYKLDFYLSEYTKYKTRFFGQLLVRGNSPKMTVRSVLIG